MGRQRLTAVEAAKCCHSQDESCLLQLAAQHTKTTSSSYRFGLLQILLCIPGGSLAPQSEPVAILVLLAIQDPVSVVGFVRPEENCRHRDCCQLLCCHAQLLDVFWAAVPWLCWSKGGWRWWNGEEQANLILFPVSQSLNFLLFHNCK